MAISPNNIITYKNLTDTFLAWLKTSCKNIGSYASDVPAYFKKNYKTKVSDKVKAFNQDGVATEAEAGVNINIRNTSVIPTVTIATVESDFNSFMQSRGINTKSDLTITTRGIINFWNNVASFCSVNILFVTGSSAGTSPTVKTFRMYKTKGGGEYPSVPGTTEGELISSNDVKTLLSNLEETINKTSKTHQLIYDMVAFSSSSSSSSSCSCCSCCSSSSSSSSAFIVYMKL